MFFSAEDALRESEERFRCLFEEAPIAYHEIDREGIVQRVNRAECDLLGYDAAEMLGHPVWRFVAGDLQAASRAAISKKISEEQPLVAFARDYVRRDGERLILEVHENLIRDSNGAVVGIRSALLDITARRNAEEALQRRAEELARSNQELEQFAYVASHDLQEPLRKIQAFGDLLKTRCEDTLSEQGRDYLARMQNAAGRMHVLINDLLSLSRVGTRRQPFVRVDLGTVLQAVLSDLEVRIQELGARMETGTMPVIEADPLQMSQLLQNLIGNALKFHRPGETPRVRIQGEMVAGEEGPACRILVEDNGIGFDEKYLDRIFQVFQRLHGRGQYDGTGVGLAVCRRIAERHGGAITATSAPGQGARFLVTLPAAQSQRMK